MKINQIGTESAITFAVGELKKYIEIMDKSEDIQISEDCAYKDGFLNIGICSEFDKLLPAVPDKKLDDAIYVDVNCGTGTITGTNPRSVLIAVYRFLKEAGVKFIRPGADNEIIPEADISDLSVKISEQPSYRHREVCIEGSCSYEHVSDIIDWIPKIGMNGYYIQFMKPYGFFNLWYNHVDNPYRKPEPKTDEELAEIHKKLVDEIAERGLLHFAVGHTWNTAPIGIDATYWDEFPEPTPEIRKYLAEIDGKRDWYHGVPMNTNLCYSNPEVKELIANAVVNYIKENPTVDYIVLWLADDVGNRCECSECKKSTFSDLYVSLLNYVDERLTELNFDTKIVFSLKANPPMTERFKKNDRIVMMSCPIYRDFSDTFPLEITDDYRVELPIFDENERAFNKLLKPVKNNVAELKRWQDIYDGDSQMYDYQLMWFHQKDPGYMMSAENISIDMKALKTIGINGINSCQLQRLFFPTALPMITMAETLWNRDKEFEEIKNTYLTDAFGKDGIALGELLNVISQRKILKAMSGTNATDWGKYAGEETRNDLKKSYEAIEKIKVLIDKNINDNSHPDAVRHSWYYLTFYPDFAKYYTDVWMASYGENNSEKATKITREFVDWLHKNDDALNRVLDCYRMSRIVRSNFESKITDAVTANAEG